MKTGDLIRGFGFLQTAWYGEYDSNGDKIFWENAYTDPDALAIELGDIAYLQDIHEQEELSNRLFSEFYPEMPYWWEHALMGTICGTVGCERIACTDIGYTAACARCAEPFAKHYRTL